MTAIEKITIGSTAEEGRAVFSGSSAARILSIGNSWTRLRIGCRLAFDDAGVNIVSPRLRIGVMSNPDAILSNGPLLNACSNYWGLYTTNTFTRSAGSPPYYTVPIGGMKKIASTETSTSLSPGTYAAAPSSYRNFLILDFAKGTDGSANWGFGGLFCYTSSYNIDCTKAQLVVAMSASLGESNIYTGLGGVRTQMASLLGISTGGMSLIWFSSTYTLSEASNGILNAIVVAWDNVAYAMRLSEILYISH